MTSKIIHSLLLRRAHQILQSVVCIIRVTANLETVVFCKNQQSGPLEYATHAVRCVSDFRRCIFLSKLFIYAIIYTLDPRRKVGRPKQRPTTKNRQSTESIERHLIVETMNKQLSEETVVSRLLIQPLTSSTKCSHA